MKRDLRVHLLPTLLEPEELRGGIAVVIDVLRAATTICHALDAGARCVVPFERVEAARRFAEAHPGESIVLGGERQSARIEGFDLDNSPFSYTPPAVGGQVVGFTTTNGTRALARSQQAERIILGAFVNLTAVVGFLAEDTRPVHLVCAGTDGKITGEDVLCAGAIVDRLKRTGTELFGNDSARIAGDYYRAHAENLLEAIRNSRGGRNLRRLGFEADIARAAEIDRFTLVPEYSAHSGEIQAVTNEESIQ